jgi:hypothetical protein
MQWATAVAHAQLVARQPIAVAVGDAAAQALQRCNLDGHIRVACNRCVHVRAEVAGYQQSDVAVGATKSDTRNYSHYYPRRLMAEVLLDAYSQVTGVPTGFQVDLRNENRGLGEKYPFGFRAIQLPDTKIASYFLKTFGRPDREKTCECERTAEPNVAQVLHIANGDSVNQKLGAKDNVISREIAAKLSPDKLIEDAYLSALSRYPTRTEHEKMLKVFSEAKEDEMRSLVEDMYWALLSSKEFLFNH